MGYLVLFVVGAKGSDNIFFFIVSDRVLDFSFVGVLFNKLLLELIDIKTFVMSL